MKTRIKDSRKPVADFLRFGAADIRAHKRNRYGWEGIGDITILLEAAIGIEPMNKGFADLCLTTWLRRPVWKEPLKKN